MCAAHLRSAPMNLALTDDQQFFQETTRKFLEQEAPITAVRALDRHPRRLRPRLVGAGRRAGVDLAARARGRRWWQPQRRGCGRPRDRGRGDGTAGLARSARAPPTSLPPRWPTAVRPSCGPRCCRDHRRRDRRRVVHRRARRRLGRGGVANHGHARRRRLRARRESARRSKRAAQADELLVTARTERRAHAVPGPGRCPGRARSRRLDSVDLVRRFATVRFDAVRVRRVLVVGDVGGAAAAVERQLQLAIVLQCAETVGALEPGRRVHPRIPGGSQLVRPAIGVVPGDQAPVRRHEDVVGRLARRHRARRPGAAGRRSRSARDRERRRLLPRRPRHRAGARVHAAPRGHRGDLGTRPAPLPAAGHDRTGRCYGTPAQHRERIATILLDDQPETARA